MNELQFRRALLDAFGATGKVNNEYEFRLALVEAITNALSGGGYTDSDARNAIKTKTEIAALTGSSDIGDVVAALQA